MIGLTGKFARNRNLRLVVRVPGPDTVHHGQGQPPVSDVIGLRRLHVFDEPLDGVDTRATHSRHRDDVRRFHSFNHLKSFASAMFLSQLNEWQVLLSAALVLNQWRPPVLVRKRWQGMREKSETCERAHVWEWMGARVEVCLCVCECGCVWAWVWVCVAVSVCVCVCERSWMWVAECNAIKVRERTFEMFLSLRRNRMWLQASQKMFLLSFFFPSKLPLKISFLSFSSLFSPSFPLSPNLSPFFPQPASAHWEELPNWGAHQEMDEFEDQHLFFRHHRRRRRRRRRWEAHLRRRHLLSFIRVRGPVSLNFTDL